MTHEFNNTFGFRYGGILHKKARVTAKIGDLVYLVEPLEGKHVHLVEEYVEDEDTNMIASVAVMDELVSLDDVEHSVLIAIDEGACGSL